MASQKREIERYRDTDRQIATARGRARRGGKKVFKQKTIMTQNVRNMLSQHSYRHGLSLLTYLYNLIGMKGFTYNTNVLIWLNNL